MTSSPESPGAPTDEATKDSYTFLDASGNSTIPVMMDMVEQLSEADDPHQVLKAFREGFRRLSGPEGYVSLSTRGLLPRSVRQS